MAVMQLILSPEEDALPQRIVCESVMQKESDLSSQQLLLCLLPSMLFLLVLKMF